MPANASVACRVAMLAREFNAAAARLLASSGVTPLQASVFSALLHGTTSPSKMAEDIGIESSGVSRALQAMEARGWIHRGVDPANRTRIRVDLTPKGQTMARRIDPHAAVIQVAVNDALGPGAPEELGRMLAQISIALGRVGLER